MYARLADDLQAAIEGVKAQCNVGEGHLSIQACDVGCGDGSRILFCVMTHRLCKYLCAHNIPSPTQGIRDPKVRATLSKFDTDGNGTVESTELIAAAQALRTARDKEAVYRRLFVGSLVRRSGSVRAQKLVRRMMYVCRCDK